MLSPVRISSTGYRRPGQKPMRLDRQKFIMCIVIIYDAVRAVRFAGLETIRNNDAAVINFTGSRVTVLTQFCNEAVRARDAMGYWSFQLVPRGQSLDPTHGRSCKHYH